MFLKKAHLWLMFFRNDDFFFIFSSITSGMKRTKGGNCFPEQTHKYNLTHFDLSLTPPNPKKCLDSSNWYCSGRKMQVEAREVQSPFLIPSAMKTDLLITD